MASDDDSVNASDKLQPKVTQRFIVEENSFASQPSVFRSQKCECSIKKVEFHSPMFKK